MQKLVAGNARSRRKEDHTPDRSWAVCAKRAETVGLLALRNPSRGCSGADWRLWRRPPKPTV